MSSAPYPNPQAIFYQQYESARRDEVVGILLRCFWAPSAFIIFICAAPAWASSIAASAGRA